MWQSLNQGYLRWGLELGLLLELKAELGLELLVLLVLKLGFEPVHGMRLEPEIGLKL